jgi:hypothetical protein
VPENDHPDLAHAAGLTQKVGKAQAFNGRLVA